MSSIIRNSRLLGTAPFNPMNLLPDGVSVEEAAVLKGLNFTIAEAPDLWMDPNGELRGVPEKKVLYRTDTMQRISTVGQAYQVVQPIELLDINKALIDAAGFSMRSAGAIFGGKRIWTVAKTGEAIVLPGEDVIEGYFYMGTSYDTTTSNWGFFTTLALTCWNMLQRAINEATKLGTMIRIPHSKEFDKDEILMKLNQSTASWEAFTEGAKATSRRRVNDREAMEFILKVFGKEETLELEAGETATEEQLIEAVDDLRVVKQVYELFNGAAMGSDKAARAGTAWGLVNAVTEYVDHHRPSQNPDYRFNNAMMGAGARRKEKAWTEALLLTA